MRLAHGQRGRETQPSPRSSSRPSRRPPSRTSSWTASRPVRAHGPTRRGPRPREEAPGDAFGSVDQKYYGSEYAAAHLVVRALLLHEDPAPLLETFERAENTAQSKQWYSMHRFGLAGPTLLAIERARAPLVEVPTDLAAERAGWDARAGALDLTLRARRDVRAAVVVAPRSGPRRELAVEARAGQVVRLSQPVP